MHIKIFPMQHQVSHLPSFTFTIDGEHVDVNVHPTKMELRFNNQQEVYNTLYEAIDSALHGRELIPKVTLDEPKVPRAEVVPVTKEKQNFRTTGSSVSFRINCREYDKTGSAIRNVGWGADTGETKIENTAERREESGLFHGTDEKACNILSPAEFICGSKEPVRYF